MFFLQNHRIHMDIGLSKGFWGILAIIKKPGGNSTEYIDWNNITASRCFKVDANRVRALHHWTYVCVQRQEKELECPDAWIGCTSPSLPYDRFTFEQSRFPSVFWSKIQNKSIHKDDVRVLTRAGQLQHLFWRASIIVWRLYTAPRTAKRLKVLGAWATRESNPVLPF